MDKSYFLKLLRKNQTSEITKEEQELLNRYYDLFDNEPEVLEMLDIAGQESIRTDMQNAIRTTLAESGKSSVAIVPIKKRYTNLAAAMIMLLIVSASLFYFLDISSKPGDAEQQNGPHTALPVKENRIIFLADGSKVMLSAGSKLNYPSSFDGHKRREVFLTGQAYFDIKHNAAMPFVVHTDELETEVLGTAFNIRAVEGEENIIVTVTHGKVKVIDPEKKETIGIITPNQQITFHRGQPKITRTSVDSEKVTEWKNEDLLCDDLTVSEAFILLEERYKVQILMNDQSAQAQRFTTVFSKNGDLDQALKSICAFNGLVYQYDRERSVVTVEKQ